MQKERHLHVHLIKYLFEDGMGIHDNYLRDADDKEGIHMHLIVSIGAKCMITFSAVREGPDAELDWDGAVYKLELFGFELETRPGIDMYLMSQFLSDASNICYDTSSREHGIRGMHKVNRIGVNYVGSMAIVVDFTVDPKAVGSTMRTMTFQSIHIRSSTMSVTTLILCQIVLKCMI